MTPILGVLQQLPTRSLLQICPVACTSLSAPPAESARCGRGLLLAGAREANPPLGLLPSFTHLATSLGNLLTHAFAASVRLEKNRTPFA